MASLNCPSCGAPVPVPERVDGLVVTCSFCSRTIELPDRDRRLRAQQHERQADRSHALALEHLRSAQSVRNRIMAVIFATVMLTIGIVFYKVFFGGLR